MSIRFSTRTIFRLIAFCLLLQGCTSMGAERPKTQVTIKVVVLPVLSSAPFFIAQENSYFAEQGLTIELVKMERASQAIPALAQGELDVVGGSMSFSILNAIARGAKIKFVADRGYVDPQGCVYPAIVARSALVKSGELSNLAQAKGRRIVLDPTNFEGYLTDKLLSPAGLTLDNMQRVDVPDAVLLDAFEKGTIDIAHAGEPWLTRILQAGNGVVWKTAQEVIPDFQLAFIVFGPTLLEKNREAGNKFMTAYLKGVRQYNQGKTERNLEMIGKHTALERAFLQQACWPSLRDNGQINVQSVLDFQAWALKKGAIDQSLNEGQFSDPAFIEYANQVLGKPAK